jgi:hypothetical protein
MNRASQSSYWTARAARASRSPRRRATAGELRFLRGARLDDRPYACIGRLLRMKRLENQAPTLEVSVGVGLEPARELRNGMATRP